jgi:ABC-type bacteriocin/lantibiotic exporter with double-glycine peptidase domain
MVKKNENGLSKACLLAFKREYGNAIFWNLIVTILQLATPFLLQWIIKFI